MKTPEQHELTIEDLSLDITRLNEFLEYSQNSRIDGDIKREFVNRLIKEIDWLEQIRTDEQEALNFKELMIDEKVDNEIDELIAKRHGESE